jgi:hypothetical protein
LTLAEVLLRVRPKFDADGAAGRRRRRAAGRGVGAAAKGVSVIQLHELGGGAPPSDEEDELC